MGSGYHTNETHTCESTRHLTMMVETVKLKAVMNCNLESGNSISRDRERERESGSEDDRHNPRHPEVGFELCNRGKC
jgi:hypothetical protein